MKKIVMLMIVAVLMFGVSGQAMAAMQEGDLIRVVYSGTGAGTEYATDLGAFTPTSLSNLATSSDTFSLASVGASSWSNVNVAYFIMSSAGYAATSGPAIGGGNINTYAFWGSYQPGASNTLDGFNVFGTVVGKNSTLSQSNSASYWNQMNGGGTMIGTMGNYLATGNAEKNLGALSTTGYVDQVLYYYGSDPDSGAQGTKVAYLRTNANGTTFVSASDPTATPIPAAAYLFGSGLMGLIGLRRKMTA